MKITNLICMAICGVILYFSLNNSNEYFDDGFCNSVTGSYVNSCFNCKLKNNKLSCDCLTVNRNIGSTTLNTQECTSCWAYNDDGTLKCSYKIKN